MRTPQLMMENQLLMMVAYQMDRLGAPVTVIRMKKLTKWDLTAHWIKLHHALGTSWMI